ncbi:MAG: TrmH family RNA methyltransferase [Proteobacteria bacterium]|nr:TrmH family RNA methyltransferase [Pseudomonadota bacterium]MBU1716105.1 TrmH family RNA methyltransferase [Pseudomonadota bacterium]
MGKLRQDRQRERELSVRRYEKHKRLNYLAKPGIHDFIIVLDNLKQAFNIGKIFRSADAFGAHEVHLIGINYFDPAPAKGSFKWVPARFHDDFYSCYHTIAPRDYTFFVLDPEKGELIHDAVLPKRSAFIFGHEEFGFSFAPDSFANVKFLRVPQYGKVQSLNVSIAASIVMYEYTRCRQSAATPIESTCSIE